MRDARHVCNEQKGRIGKDGSIRMMGSFSLIEMAEFSRGAGFKSHIFVIIELIRTAR